MDSSVLVENDIVYKRFYRELPHCSAPSPEKCNDDQWTLCSFCRVRISPEKTTVLGRIAYRMSDPRKLGNDLPCGSIFKNAQVTRKATSTPANTSLVSATAANGFPMNMLGNKTNKKTKSPSKGIGRGNGLSPIAWIFHLILNRFL
jgi:hypothetical protein